MIQEVGRSVVGSAEAIVLPMVYMFVHEKYVT